jgi:glutaminyl-tRNA synthetase
MNAPESTAPKNFIRAIVDEDLRTHKYDGRVVTRFPPEPNGYLHIGHAKSICLNFGIARDYGGHCALRFDDTNPLKEEDEYMNAIQEDVRWLDFDWGEHLHHASDYFDQLHAWAIKLIENGKAYVDSLSAEDIKAYRGTLTEAGKDSPYRSRSVAENLELFERMTAGEFKDGEHVLRAKIDMASPNLNMRDPTIYRIRHASHHRTGDRWRVYPLYDYTHCLSDAIENVTHSLCTLEFEDHRPLYDWVLKAVNTPEPRPQQIEFARLNIEYLVMSKRLLNQMVREGTVSGWDDPRMPTLVGMRRRGYTPAAIRDFCERVGITKKDSTVEMSSLENCLREDLDRRCPRAMAVLDPLKVVIENYPEGGEETLPAINHPNDPAMGTREVPFGREIYIERDDFLEDPPRKFFRLAPGQEVRLRYAYFITCEAVIKDASGNITELRCSYDPASRGGNSPDGRKVKGTLHWVSARHAVDAEVRLYDRLFTRSDPAGDPNQDFHTFLNPDSLKVVSVAKLEPSLAQAQPEDRFQFERLGYFCADRHDHRTDKPVFNRTVTLRDTWAKINPR